MHGGAAVAGRRWFAGGTAVLAALLAPILFLFVLFPARLLAWPFLGLLDRFGEAGSLLALSAWFCTCSLILLAFLLLASEAFGLPPGARVRLVTATWLWAVVPNLAFIVWAATWPD